MPAVSPFNVNSRAFDERGRITPEFKAFIDQLYGRVGGVTGGSYAQLRDEPSVSWNVDQAPVAVVVLGGNRTFSNPTGMVAGPLFLYRLTIVQDAVGSRFITWGSAFKFPSGTPPVLSTAANAVDEIVFDCDKTNMKMLTFTKDIR